MAHINHQTQDGRHAPDIDPARLDAIEVAYVVGRQMWSAAIGDPPVYRGGVQAAFSQIWPHHELDEVTRRRTTRILAHNGFQTQGDGIKGWLVPQVWPIKWEDVETLYHRHTKDVHSQEHIRGLRDEVTPELLRPVIKKYRCQYPDCGEEFDSSSAIGGHIVSAHLHTMDSEVREVAGNTQRLGPLSAVLFDAISARPGLHPRDYAELLGHEARAVGSLAKTLYLKGLIVRTGQRMNVRYWTAGMTTDEPTINPPSAEHLHGSSNTGPAADAEELRANLEKAGVDTDVAEEAAIMATDTEEEDVAETQAPVRMVLTDEDGNKYVSLGGKLYSLEVLDDTTTISIDGTVYTMKEVRT